MIAYTPARASLFSHYEAEADREIAAARELGYVSKRSAFWGDEDWWTGVWDMTELEIEAAKDAAWDLYRSLRFKPFKARQRREAMHNYIRWSSRLTRGCGMTTMWA